MTLDSLVTMARADRYTQDGRDVVNDVRKTYQIGQISEATGLQKTANGWVKPKQGNGGNRTLSKEIENKNHFEESKNASAKAKKEEALKAERDEGEARAGQFQKAVEAVQKENPSLKGDDLLKAASEKLSSGKQESKEEKWVTTKNDFGRNRLTMKTKQGGQVHIYETENPNQKNSRFRVDTGTHYNLFNTLEEAKQFAEKHWGPEDAAPRELTGDTRIHVRK